MHNVVMREKALPLRVLPAFQPRWRAVRRAVRTLRNPPFSSSPRPLPVWWRKASSSQASGPRPVPHVPFAGRRKAARTL